MIAATIPLPRAVPPVLALGAFLKNTVCVTKDATAYLSPVHGDLGTPEAIAAFEASVEAMVAELGVAPVRVAHDLHPDFHSTRYAQSLSCRRCRCSTTTPMRRRWRPSTAMTAR